MHPLLRRLAGDRLDGPPWSLPTVLDAAAERWWSMPPRLRTVTVLLLVVATPLVAAVALRPPPPTLVAVAARDLPAGHQVLAADVRQVRWPPALAPPGARRDAVGDVTRSAVPAGSPIVAGHLDDQGVGGGLAVGRAAVPAPASELPPLTAGQRVDVLAGGIDGQGRALAVAARVAAVDAETVWLDVARVEAAPVAGALAAGALTVAVLPP